MELRNLVEKENCNVSFEMALEGSEWKEQLKKASASLQKQKAVPGYRAGKAPLGIVEKTFGQSLFDTASRTAMPELFTQVCQEHDYAPVSNPNFAVVQADMEGFCVQCSFTNYPKVTDMQYKGLKPEKLYRVCNDADIDEAIDKYMRQHLYVHEVPREARMGDIVEVSFTGTHNGGPFDYDHSNKSRFVLGSGQLFAGLDEELVGHVADDDLELSLTMPEDFHREAVQGLTLDLKVHLRGVWARDLLECTDEYVKEHIKDCETLAEFREQNRQKLQSRYDSESERLYNKKLDKALADALPCDVPEAMIGVAVDRFVNTLRGLAARDGKTAEQVLEEEGKTMEMYLEQVRPYALQQVRMSVALDYIARTEKIPVSQAEVDNHFRKRAEEAKISIDEAKRREGGEEAYIEKLLNDRAMKIVRENAEPIMVQVDSIPTDIL